MNDEKKAAMHSHLRFAAVVTAVAGAVILPMALKQKQEAHDLRPRAAAAFQKFKGELEGICIDRKTDVIVITKKKGSVDSLSSIDRRMILDTMIFTVYPKRPSKVTFNTSVPGMFSLSAFSETLDAPRCK
jgi:F420-0:gamma-glutamyl ligase